MSFIEPTLVERWQQLREKYPDAAAQIKQIICALYAVRNDREQFDGGLNALQEELTNGVLNTLALNATDRQALAIWAQAMGMIFLVGKEQKLKGRHRH
ncbi:MAG: hypothetical protein AAB449_00580 [Patescibacteria group bacterium]